MAKTHYQTKQMQVIKNFLLQNKNMHVTAIDICNSLAQSGISIGTATVYRQLDKLVSTGEVYKYQIDAKSPACFEYVGDKSCTCHCREHMQLHCKCTCCNKVFHIDAKTANALFKEIEKDILFSIDPMRTVFYGLCKECKENTTKE